MAEYSVADVNYVGFPQASENCSDQTQKASQKGLQSLADQQRLGYLQEVKPGLSGIGQATSAGLAGKAWSGLGQTPPQTCPCCGYCSHCGRSNPNYPSYPQITYTSGNIQKAACNANTY